jgi:hypothetical protein
MISHGDTPLSVEAILQDWTQDVRFAEVLAGSPFEGFCWEVPPLGVEDTGSSFECVVINEVHLPRFRANPAGFSDRFASDGAEAIAFPNVSGDATLVVPRPLPGIDADAYGHIAAFLRRAPRRQVNACFKLLSTTVHATLDAAPRWISTAGLGVPWLHFRIDTTPKYYRWPPYRERSQRPLPG